MPQKIRERRFAPATGKGSRSRAKKQDALRFRRKEAAPAPAIISDSLYSLVCRPKLGIEVFTNKGGRNYDITDPLKLYHDLYGCYRNYLLVNESKEMNICFLKDVKLSLPFAIQAVIVAMKGHIPAGYFLNIDDEGYGSDNYFFTVYRELEQYNGGLVIFEIKHIYKYIKKLNPIYAEVLLQFIHCLHQYLGIPIWYSGSSFDYAIEHLLEEQDNEEDFGQEIAKDLQRYINGDVMEMQRLILRSGLSIKELKDKLASLKSKHPAIEWMREYLPLLETSYTIDNYVYDIGDGEYDNGLRFYAQYIIAWEVDDHIFKEFSEYIDAEANEGVQSPVFFHQVKKNTSIKLNDVLPDAQCFLKRLSAMHDRFCDIGYKIKRPSKKRTNE